MSRSTALSRVITSSSLRSIVSFCSLYLVQGAPDDVLWFVDHTETLPVALLMSKRHGLAPNSSQATTCPLRGSRARADEAIE
jgi:hypothetical protein